MVVVVVVAAVAGVEISNLLLLLGCCWILHLRLQTVDGSKNPNESSCVRLSNGDYTPGVGSDKRDLHPSRVVLVCGLLSTSSKTVGGLTECMPQDRVTSPSCDQRLLLTAAPGQLLKLHPPAGGLLV